jgi:3-hydroxyacyl-CoA dehydrogenase
MNSSSNLISGGGQIVREIRKVAVLGAETMGARITAHLGNASVPCLLLDTIPNTLTTDEQAKGLGFDSPQVWHRLARAGLDSALKSTRLLILPLRTLPFRKGEPKLSGGL